VPTDPGVLAHIADLYQRNNDKAQALHYYAEVRRLIIYPKKLYLITAQTQSYRYHPSSLEVLGWLGAYFIETEAYEKAIQYFEKAIFIQPYEVKWYFMEASCLRRSGNYQKAVDVYRKVHEKFPENEDCLRYLIRICTDLGLPAAKDYSLKLAKLEAIKAERAGQKPGGEPIGGYKRDSIGGDVAKPMSNTEKIGSFSNLITTSPVVIQTIPAATPILLSGGSNANDAIDWNNENVEELLP
jgi:intraflagellar transport protein 88